MGDRWIERYNPKQRPYVSRNWWAKDQKEMATVAIVIAAVLFVICISVAVHWMAWLSLLVAAASWVIWWRAHQKCMELGSMIHSLHDERYFESQPKE